MSLDLNSDVGESFSAWRVGDDEAILAVVSSANVACGFHAGDAATARQTCRWAAAYGVTVGAHVGYNDLAGFGRRSMDVDPGTLADETLYQIGALRGIATAEDVTVRYVKPHGALYNRIVHDGSQATAVIDGVIAAGGDLPVMGLPGSAFLQIARSRGVPVIAEAFADRAYRPDGTLLPRNEEGAVIRDATAVADRVLRLAETGVVIAVDGQPIRIDAESICVHGDTPGAVTIARTVRARLDAAGIPVRSPLAR